MFILAHNSSKAFGGGEIGTVLLLAGLQRRGHRVLMLFRDPEKADRAASYGIPTGVQRVGGDAMLPDAARLAARLRAERPDAVILTTFKKVFLSGLGARMAGTGLPDGEVAALAGDHGVGHQRPAHPEDSGRAAGEGLPRRLPLLP